MFTFADKLGVGLYAPAEAALYARVSRRVMKRWVFGDSESRPVIDRQFSDSDGKVVSFLDFVQILAVREIRNRHGLSLQKIRRGVDAATERYGISLPLARQHTIYLFGDQRGEGHGEMVIRLPEDPNDLATQFVQLTGQGKESRLIGPVVETFLADLAFDPASNLASKYSPMTCDGASIVLDPHRRFGAPLVDPGGYTVEALWDATNVEGGIEKAAEAYGVGVAEVMLANRYYDGLIMSTVG